MIIFKLIFFKYILFFGFIEFYFPKVFWISEFRINNPDCLKSISKVSDQYNKLVFEAFGGKGDNDLEKEDKIIKNIAKEVTIESKS